MADYAPGVPIWVDVSSVYLDRTIEFYTAVFGWDANRGGPEFGGYTIFMVDGKMVAGAGPTMSPDQHPAWMTYLKTDDSEATVKAVEAAGGRVVTPTIDVMDQGRMTVFQDPTGAFFSTWQPGTHPGAELVNEPNSFCWNELYTRDLPRDLEFYKAAFGYEIEETEMGPNGKYTMLKLDGKPAGGAMDMASVDLPLEIPPHWLVYFSTSDLAASIDKIAAAGGSTRGPMDTPVGAFAIVTDPVGAVCAIIQFRSDS